GPQLRSPTYNTNIRPPKMDSRHRATDTVGFVREENLGHEVRISAETVQHLPAKLFLMTSGGFAQMRLEHLLPFHRMLCDHHHASSTQILSWSIT
ncbi:hypothetical protein L9F63_009991, partial [Diploptera punctata]